MIVLAHAGHWLVSLAYLMPLVVLGIVMLVGKLRHRDVQDSQAGVREGAEKATAEPPGAKTPL